MNADRVEELLVEQLSKLLGSIDSVHKDDHLIEGQSIQQVGQLFELFVLRIRKGIPLRCKGRIEPIRGE